MAHTFLSLVALFALCSSLLAASQPFSITNFQANGLVREFQFHPGLPATEQYRILSAPEPAANFLLNSNFQIVRYTNVFLSGTNLNTNVGYLWRTTNATATAEFYRLEAIPMDSNALLAANALNRLGYGPTPELLTRLRTEGPHGYITAQLAPWTIVERANQTHTNILSIEGKFVPAAGFVERTNAGIADLRAWHVLRAVNADRQLLEVLLQFLENHFVTQFEKSSDFFDRYYDSGTMRDRLATQLEYLENARWRGALLKPDCTFHDLLKTTAESPAMIIYLDTVDSRGDGNNVANENYARELLELFTFGVDNGYDQSDITTMSRAWTGWYVDKVDFANINNPFSITSTNIIPGSTNLSTTTKSNLFAAWAFNFRSSRHNTSVKTIFPSKTVPARYGAPWAGRNYQLVLSNGSGTNGIQDGYQVLRHLADQPFTQEYVSVKLCRLLVHDGFPHPSPDPATPEYAFYNYAAGNLSPEAALVHGCMQAWETNSPKGQIWKVLQVITDSKLFRSHGGSLQKVKTPLEMVASTIRALRFSTNGSNLAGSFTAWTDGFNLVGTSESSTGNPMMRMGDMSLFNREAPDGYPEGGPSWISAGTLAERLRFIQAFCIAPSQTGHTDAGSLTGCDPVGLIRAQLPAASLTNSGEVADFFIRILFPGEGGGNLDYYRLSATQFLNTDDNGVASPFGRLTVSSIAGSPYDNRLRGMVGMLMTMPRFQEQ